VKELQTENAELRERLAKLEESNKNIETALRDLLKKKLGNVGVSGKPPVNRLD